MKIVNQIGGRGSEELQDERRPLSTISDLFKDDFW